MFGRRLRNGKTKTGLGGRARYPPEPPGEPIDRATPLVLVLVMIVRSPGYFVLSFVEDFPCDGSCVERMQASQQRVQYGTERHGTVQYSTVQYSTVQYSTVQYSTVQYGTVRDGMAPHRAVQCSAVQILPYIFYIGTFHPSGYYFRVLCLKQGIQFPIELSPQIFSFLPPSTTYFSLNSCAFVEMRENANLRICHTPGIP